MFGNSESSLATLPFPKSEVFKATLEVTAKMKGFKVKESDEILGRINLVTSTSATSWGEAIPIQLNEKDSTHTDIIIVSRSNTGIMAGGLLTKKNEQNVELLLGNISKFLQGKEIVVKGGSKKGIIATLLIAIFFGWLGLHRFFVGKWKTGLLYLVTLGFAGIGWLLDVVRIIFGNFTDKDGNYISNW